MMAEVVDRAPQRWMLGHSDQDCAARLDRFAHRFERPAIIVEVLDDVECTDQIELTAKRQPLDVDLDRLDRRKTRLRPAQPLEQNFAGGDPDAWKPVRDRTCNG